MPTEADWEVRQMLKLADKDFRKDIINMFKINQSTNQPTKLTTMYMMSD